MASNEEKRNILDLVTGLNIVTAMSKGGKPYEIYEVEFQKDFKFRFFLERAEGQVVRMLEKQRDEKESRFNLDEEK